MQREAHKRKTSAQRQPGFEEDSHRVRRLPGLRGDRLVYRPLNTRMHCNTEENAE